MYRIYVYDFLGRYARKTYKILTCTFYSFKSNNVFKNNYNVTVTRIIVDTPNWRLNRRVFYINLLLVLSTLFWKKTVGLHWYNYLDSSSWWFARWYFFTNCTNKINRDVKWELKNIFFFLQSRVLRVKFVLEINFNLLNNTISILYLKVPTFTHMPN